MLTGIRRLLAFGLAAVAMTSCTSNKAELGTAENPIKFFLVPSVDAKVLEDTGRILKAKLEEMTPYKYKFAVPSSYVAVVEAFGTKRADVASINTFGYIMAHEKYNVDAAITFVRHGSETYKAQIIARADSGINKIEDFKGKKFAYVDPASTSGYLLPAKLFKERNVEPSETMFAQKHDNVVTMVYQKQVDGGATFYSPPDNGKIEDARRLVKTQFPDVEDVVKIVELTEAIPNDPIAMRHDLPAEMKEKIIQALVDFQKTEQGNKVFYDIYGITGMVRTTNDRYDGVRKMLETLGKKASELSK